jgi:hypothetical protein
MRVADIDRDELHRGLWIEIGSLVTSGKLSLAKTPE